MITCLDCRKQKRCMEWDRMIPCRSFALSDKPTPGKVAKPKKRKPKE